MRIRNRFGYAPAAVAFYAWLGSCLILATAAYQLKDSHRVRKAVEFCQMAGNSQETCESIVAEWSDEQVLTFISDTEDGELARGSFGITEVEVAEPNLNHGYGLAGNF